MSLRVAFFSSKPYDEGHFRPVNAQYGFDLTFFEVRLNKQTVKLAEGFDAICTFVNDCVDEVVLQAIQRLGIKTMVLRCAGFNNVDLEAAERFGIQIARVPAYSPAAVAEHAVGLMLCLNRKYHRAYNRVREGNFALNGLVGFDMRGKTVGVVGTGKIGQALVPILSGFGCHVLAYDVAEAPEVLEHGAQYVSLHTLWQQSDIISFHCPLVPETQHLVNEQNIAQMKPGVMLINTSRGGIIDTPALIDGLKSGKIGSVGLDVYEEEENLFFEDLSNTILQDDVFSRLLTFPNVLITGHQAFLTDNALTNIAQTTLDNLACLSSGKPCLNLVKPLKVAVH